MKRAGRRPRDRLLALLLVFAALAGVYSLATPVFEGPDEIWHFAFASHLADGQGLPLLSAERPNLLLRNAAHPPLYYLPVAGLIAPIDRRDFPAAFRFNLASPHITPGSVSDRPNLLIHTAHEDWPWRQTALAVHLARLVSIALGVLSLWGVWEGARRLMPGGPALPLLAVALAASVPQFVYGAGLINNDALAAAAGAWCLVALVELTDTLSLRWALVAGLLVGVGLLSKIGMVALLPLPVAALVLANFAAPPALSQAARLRRSFRAGLVVYGTAALAAGWWYARNWRLYGDPLAWRQWQALAGVGRSGVTPLRFAADLLGLFGTFWVDFGLRVDRGWVWAFAVLACLALGGLVVRWRRRRWPQLHLAGVLLATLWLCLLLASAVRYALVVTDIHGRLLYPALTGVSVALALGLTGWGDRIGRKMALGAASGLLLVTVAAPFFILRPAFARPVVAGGSLPGQAAPLNITFADAVTLAGYQAAGTRLRPGDYFTVATYWRLGDGLWPPPDTHAVLALIRSDGQVIARQEALIGTTLYPSSVWQPGDLVALTARVSLEDTVEAPVAAQLVLGVRAASAALLSSPLGDSVNLGRITVSNGRPCDIPANAGQVFGEAVRLVGYVAGERGVSLCWEALRPLAEDYTVFVHILAPDGTPVGTADGPPRQGLYPTSAWQPGEQVEDYHAADIPEGARIQIGLYRLEDGQRLPLSGSSETALELPR